MSLIASLSVWEQVLAPLAQSPGSDVLRVPHLYFDKTGKTKTDASPQLVPGLIFRERESPFTFRPVLFRFAKLLFWESGFGQRQMVYKARLESGIQDGVRELNSQRYITSPPPTFTLHSRKIEFAVFITAAIYFILYEDVTANERCLLICLRRW